MEHCCHVWAHAPRCYLEILDEQQKQMCRTVGPSTGSTRCYKDVYVNSFFPCTARLWNSLPTECFPLTYDLIGFKSRIILRFFINRFYVCFNLFVVPFLVTPCLVVAVQHCME